MIYSVDDTFITSISIGPVSADPIPPDVTISSGGMIVIGNRVISCDPSTCIVALRTRRVMRAKRTPNGLSCGITPYSGTVKPRKGDISFTYSWTHGTQAIYNPGTAIDEPILEDHQLPTATYVSFVHVMVPARLQRQRLANGCPLYPHESYYTENKRKAEEDQDKATIPLHRPLKRTRRA